MTRPELFLVAITVNQGRRVKIHRCAFIGTKYHSINLEYASRLTKRFRDTMPANAIKGGYFGRLIYENILAQESCVGIRYFASFDNGTPTIVRVGVE